MRNEYSYERNLDFSQWHRSLSNKCIATNIDFMELRYKNGGLTIPAFIEEKDDRATLKDWQKNAFITLSKMSGIPFYLIKHNCCKRLDHKAKWRFDITNVETGKNKLMTELELRDFIENL